MSIPPPSICFVVGTQTKSEAESCFRQMVGHLPYGLLKFANFKTLIYKTLLLSWPRIQTLNLSLKKLLECVIET